MRPSTASSLHAAQSIGALIDAGANAPKELFHIAAINKLRIYVAVPEVYSPRCSHRSARRSSRSNIPEKYFTGIWSETRTLWIPRHAPYWFEVEVDQTVVAGWCQAPTCKFV